MKPMTHEVSPTVKDVNPNASVAALLGWIALVINPLGSMSIAAIILGTQSLRRSRALEIQFGASIGRREALTGIVVGSIALALWAILLMLFIAFVQLALSRVSPL